MRRLMFAALCLLGATAGLWANGWDGWSKFKAGSFAKYKITTAVATTKMTSESKMTLLSVGAGKATVETEVTAMGNTSKSKADINLNGEVKGTAQSTPMKKGSETITVAGKSFSCDTYEMDTNANGMQVHTKSWVSAQVPGGLVKSVSTSTGAMKSETVMELVDFKN